ncbi:MAG: 2-hydroxyacid dehydrogenase [Defluviicoccus sp.]|nr:2-hydroxyacid dehydrogenase [Defluviicoccus sp.]MDE0386259.1 2-hydroxyacid dehydrogenase [Defluviicoccus sp.]
MTAAPSCVLVAHDPAAEARSVYRHELGARSELLFRTDLAPGDWEAARARARVLIAQNPRIEIAADDVAAMASLGFVQLLTAGVDHVPLHLFPRDLPIASNAGAFAGPMAEFALAMTLAAAKRLPVEHREMRDGRFNQFVANRTLDGAVCAIIGFGGVGRQAARLFRALGAGILAINRSGETGETVAFIGTLAALEDVLRAADVVLVSLSLTDATAGLIGARELGWMKDDAILVNVARGEIVDQGALYRHLVANPRFFACLESWWVEPVRHGEFRIDHPFLDLPNVIAAPHNSASVAGAQAEAVRLGARNVRRWLDGETPRSLLGADERGD